MKRLALILLLGSVLAASAQTISYWWSQELKKPDAKQSQEFFFIPGLGVYFTYTNNRVVINASNTAPGFVGRTTNICVIFCDGSTNVLSFTNGLLAAVNGPPPPHAASIIQPLGAGYIIQPDGSTLLLP